MSGKLRRSTGKYIQVAGIFWCAVKCENLEDCPNESHENAIEDCPWSLNKGTMLVAIFQGRRHVFLTYFLVPHLYLASGIIPSTPPS